MRAHALWQALAACTDTTVIVVPVAEAGSRADCDTDCLRAELPSPATAAASWLSNDRGRELLAAAGELPRRARLAAPVCTGALAAERQFEIVYVLRLYLAGTALPFLAPQSTTRVILDIDEDDAAVSRQLAALLDLRGEHREAEQIRAEAAVQERFAAAAFPLFDRVTCASELEATALATRGVPAWALPNVVAVRAQTCTDSKVKVPQLLFLGNLDYAPNRDAVLRLVTDILPAVRSKCPDARLLLAGAGGDALRDACHGEQGVDWLGYVDAVESVYDRATVVVAPLRAGGGSRLKILEAFERGVPVVASHKAVEGLEVTTGRHALLAENDTDIAAAVVQLASDPVLAERLATSARELVIERYTIEVLSQRVATLVESVLGCATQPR